MKNTIVALLLVLSSHVFAQESSLSSLESKSAVLAIDAFNHINSLQQKRGAVSKDNTPTGVKTTLKEWAAINSKTYELKSNSAQLIDSAFALMKKANSDDPLSLVSSTNGKGSPYERFNVLVRELSCTEFALYLMTNDNGVLPNESLSLANAVMSGCKRINHGAPAQESEQDVLGKKTDASKKNNNKKG